MSNAPQLHCSLKFLFALMQLKLWDKL
uniref:Uncharacterized protein n=1 Tax=Rhizophora mucronata TaxID=61149 RepID=A0A2P2R5E3_RHIMU